jgi:hypothetical protein
LPLCEPSDGVSKKIAQIVEAHVPVAAESR